MCIRDSLRCSHLSRVLQQENERYDTAANQQAFEVFVALIFNMGVGETRYLLVEIKHAQRETRNAMNEKNFFLKSLILSHLSSNREGRRGTTDDFTTSFLHFSLFSTALWDLAINK